MTRHDLMTLANWKTTTKFVLQGVAISLAYVFLATVGRTPIFSDGIVSVFWLPAALSTFCAWKFGHSAVLGVALGQAGASYLIGHDPWMFLVFASAGNAAGTGLLVWALHRPNFREGFLHKQKLATRFILIVAAADLVNAGFGTLAVLSGTQGQHSFSLLASMPAGKVLSIAWPWWSGDVASVLMMTPWMIQVSCPRSHPAWPFRRLDWIVILVSLSITGGIFLTHGERIPQSMVFLIMPPLLWLAIGGNNRSTTLILLLTVLIASVTTVRGLGPFGIADRPSGLLQLQLFTILLSVTILVVASGASERDQLIRDLAQETKLLEGRVAERTFELANNNQTLAAQNENLKRLTEEKNLFMGIAAHDLRSPLACMTLQLDILQDETDLHKIRLGMQKTQAGAIRMADLITSMLDIAAIEAGKRSPRPVALDLAVILFQVANAYRPAAEAKGIQLNLRIPDPVPDLFADDTMVREVLENLVSNAIKFTPACLPSAEVSIEVEHEIGWTYLNIQDQGPGFSKEDLNVIFKPFSRLSARPTGGESSTGLGLFIIKQLVASMGGEIRLSSLPGCGARFTIKLPSTVSFFEFLCLQEQSS